jgi:hypothetical protein
MRDVNNVGHYTKRNSTGAEIFGAQMARIRGKRSAYRISTGELGGKCVLGRPDRRRRIIKERS